MEKRPIVSLAICWIIGSAFAFASDLIVFIALMSVFLCLAILLCLFRKLKAGRAIVCLGVIVLSFGYTIFTVNQREEGAGGYQEGTQVVLNGTIASSVEVDGDLVTAVVTADRRMNSAEADSGWTLLPPDREHYLIQLRLLTPKEQAASFTWKRGDAIQLSGELKQPSKAGNFGQFDYRSYLLRQNIHWIVSAKGIDQAIVKTADNNRYTPLRYVDELRNKLGARIDKLYSSEQSGFMKGLLIGLRADLDPEQFQQFSQIGLTHVLAISGLHVGVLLVCVMGLFRLLRSTRETAILAGLIFVPFFMLVAGLGPSVIRSGLMAEIALFLAWRHRLKDGLNLISVAGLLMLLWDPYYLLNVSFQLSFLVTAGLILGVPQAGQLLPTKPKWLNSMLAVTIVAQLVSFPVTIYYFNQFSILSGIANFLFVPLFSMVTLPLGYLSLVLSFGWLAGGRWLAYFAEKVNGIAFDGIEYLNSLEGFLLIWGSPSLLWIGIYFLMLCCLTWTLCRWRVSAFRPASMDRSAGYDGVHAKDLVPPEIQSYLAGPNRLSAKSAKNLFFGLMCVFFILLGYSFNPRIFDHSGEVDVLNVGQGDAIYIRTPSGKNILVDGGGTIHFQKPGEQWKQRSDPYEVGRKLVVPILKRRGVHQLDYCIVTHQDMDHIGGLQAVLEQIPVKHLIFNGTLKDSEPAKQLFKTALERNVRLHTAVYGQVLRLDGETELHFIYPFPPENKEPQSKIAIQNEQNEYSVMFLLRMLSHSMLFTGDIDAASETVILEHLRRLQTPFLQQPLDLLKVAHHGSKGSTSAEWLAYWRPRMSVISVGEHNLYGHPAQQTVQRIHEARSLLYRTDLYGEVQFEFSPDRIRLRTKYK